MEGRVCRGGPMTAVKSGQAINSSVSSLDDFPPKYYWHLSTSSYHIHATCLDLIAVIVLGTSRYSLCLTIWCQKLIAVKEPYNVDKPGVATNMQSSGGHLSCRSFAQDTGHVNLAPNG